MESALVPKIVSGNMSNKMKDLMLLDEVSLGLKDFDIKDEALYVSKDVYTLVASYGIRTALGLIDTLAHAPSSFMISLRWTHEEIGQYREDLAKACKIVGVAFPERTEHAPRAMGAMAPPGMEWMIGRSVEQINQIRKEAEVTGKSTAEVAAQPKWKAN